VFAETKADGTLAGSTLNTISASAQLGQPITALVAGEGVDAAAQTLAKVAGVSKVIVAQHPKLKHPLPEPHAALLAQVQKDHACTAVVAPASAWGKAVLPRAAAILGVQPVADIVKVVAPDTYVRPIYAGNAMATVKYAQPGVRMITVRTSSFPPAAATAPSPAPTEALPASSIEAALAAAPASSSWVSAEVTRSVRPELGSAKVVVCGGRAMKSQEQFNALLGPVADILGAAVGASRAAVDAGMAPNDLQVGQTGKVVAPDLYIGVGVSGAIQHLAGIKDAKCIVAINTDGEAPIFQVADYGLVQDLFTALPALHEELQKLKAAS